MSPGKRLRRHISRENQAQLVALVRADASLSRALTVVLDGSASKGFVVRSDGQGRSRYKWDGTTVQFYLLPKAGGKLSVVVTNTKLAGAAILEQCRTQWRAALTALAEYLAR